MDSFSRQVAEQLRIYVYRLVDPRSGNTFYVGRGQGNRIFAHATDSRRLRTEAPPIEGETDESWIKRLKLETIREIHAAALRVIHIVHRHGLDDNEAKHVEAALIHAYPGLTNLILGFDAENRPMTIEEVFARYEPLPAGFRHRVMLVNVGATLGKRSTYDAARHAWDANPEQTSQREYVCAVRDGLIIEVFQADRWLPASTENFPGFDNRPDRIGFEGRLAPENVRSLYVNKKVAWPPRRSFIYRNPMLHPNGSQVDGALGDG